MITHGAFLGRSALVRSDVVREDGRRHIDALTVAHRILHRLLRLGLKAAGQGARARCGRWPEGAGTGRTSGKPGRCRGAPSGEISGAVEQAEPGSQSAICYSARIRTASTANLWFWRVAGAALPGGRIAHYVQQYAETRVCPRSAKNEYTYLDIAFPQKLD